MRQYSPENSSIVSAEFLRKNPRFILPHVVLLGAGASIQAFPQGDINGRLLPSMQNLVEVIGIEEELRKLGISKIDDNFETIYGRLYSNRENRSRLNAIELRIREYFSDMKLSDNPTLYDHLLLSLRPCDLIATFNWDPFLFDSWERLRERYVFRSLPQIAYLHGNVRVGYCLIDKVFGRVGRSCPHCYQPLKPSPLLYPIESKDYRTNIFIKDAWERLCFALKNAFALTIFGYGAPMSDRVAIDMLNGAWNHSGKRRYESVFIIDIKPECDIRKCWEPFLFSQHYRVYKDFYTSWLPRHARRSIEALFVPTIEGGFVEDVLIPRQATWEQLRNWYNDLSKYESEEE